MRNTKAAIIINNILSIILLLLSIVILAFFGLLTLGYIFDPSLAEAGGTTVLIIILLFDLLGIFLLIQSRKRKKLVKGFRTYVSAIADDSDGSISNIATSLGMSEDALSKDIESMINKKFFTNAYIDKATNRIIINRSQYNESFEFDADTENPLTDANRTMTPEVLSVKCKSCGGLNSIMRGQVRECDYCGSSIKGE